MNTVLRPEDLRISAASGQKSRWVEAPLNCTGGGASFSISTTPAGSKMTFQRTSCEDDVN
jgi:hypothetical protein